MATKTGRATDELVQDAMAGYLDELAEVRGMLDRRYDEIKSGRSNPSTAKHSLKACGNVKMNCSSSARRDERRTGL